MSLKCAARAALGALVFLVVPVAAYAQPAAATLVSASDAGAHEFRWNAVSGATYYYLWVNEGDTKKLHTWYTAGQALCGNSEPVCTVTVALPKMNSAQGKWWVQTWGPAGYGAWSASQSFTVRPPKPPIVVDANNRYLGTLIGMSGNESVLIDVDGEPAQVHVYGGGFARQHVYLLYPTSDCSGQAYSMALFMDRVEFTTGIAGGYLIRGTPSMATIVARRQVSQEDGTIGACSAIDGGELPVKPITPRNFTAELGPFVAPFKLVR